MNVSRDLRAWFSVEYEFGLYDEGIAVLDALMWDDVLGMSGEGGLGCEERDWVWACLRGVLLGTEGGVGGVEVGVEVSEGEEGRVGK